MKTKIAAALYFLALATIVVLADVRATQPLFAPIRALPSGDKIGHFFLMGGFSFVANLALQARKVGLRRAHFLLGSAMVMAVVTCEEFSQIFIRGRTFDLVDLAVDATGIWLFGELSRLVLKRARATRTYAARTQDF